MVQESDELVEMRRVLGEQLAAFRRAAGLNQGELGRATFCDRTSVAHIEKGRSRGDERFWTLADERCGADGVLLAGFRAWEAARQDHEVRVREALLAQARAKLEGMRASAAPHLIQDTDRSCRRDVLDSAAGGCSPVTGRAGPSACLRFAGSLREEVAAEGDDEVVGRLAKLFCGLVDAVNRRKLLRLLGSAVGTAATSPVVSSVDTEEQERLIRAIVSPNRVDNRVIDHIDGMFRYCQLQEDTLGSRAILPTVLEQRNLIRNLLEGCPSSLRVRLLVTYSSILTSIGYYFFELNDIDSARNHYEQARAAAHDAGNADLAIYSLCEWSYTEAWQGKAHVGIDLAAAAQSLVSKAEDPLMRVGVAQRAATAYAFDGQYDACVAKLARAQEDLIGSNGQLLPGSPAYFYNEGYLTSHKSECLLRLGRSQEAAATANAGLILYDKSFVDGYAVCTLHLGKAHLQSREIDEATRVVGTAVGLAAQTRSGRLVRELHATRARMQPWQNTPAVKALDEQLVAHGLVGSSVTQRCAAGGTSS